MADADAIKTQHDFLTDVAVRSITEYRTLHKQIDGFQVSVSSSPTTIVAHTHADLHANYTLHPKDTHPSSTNLCAVQGRLVLRGAMHTWGPGYFRFHDPQAGTSYVVHFRVSTHARAGRGCM
jgi:hypothetical protein